MISTLYLDVARPKKAIASVKITITAGPMLKEYLEELVLQELYGGSAAEVARALVVRGVEELLLKGVLSRKAPHSKEGE